MVGPMLVLMGLTLLVYGERVGEFMVGPSRDNRMTYLRLAYLAGILFLTWLLWLWFEGRMTALGYSG